MTEDLNDARTFESDSFFARQFKYLRIYRVQFSDELKLTVIENAR